MFNKSLTLIFILISAIISSAQDVRTLEPITEKNGSELHQVGQLGRGEAYNIAWKPDGETLAVVSNAGVWLYDADFDQIDYWPYDYDYVWELAWSPNGMRLAILTDESLTVLRSDGSMAYEISVPIKSFSWHPFDNIVIIA